MTQWRIEVRGDTPEDVSTHRFSRLPIAIGRHDSNDLRLQRGFVSGFHARVDETAGRLTVVDLGSTNGVYVRSTQSGRNRIASHEAHDLATTDGEFCVGAYSIRVFRNETGAAAESLGSSAFNLPALPEPAGSAAPAGGVESDAVGLPEPHARRSSSSARSQRAREAAALAGLEQLARGLGHGQALETSADVARLIRRLQAAVELSCRGVVRLRRGQRRCASALRLPDAAGALGKGEVVSEDPAELARQLLDVRRPAKEAAATLSREFHALACHQVALFEGVLEGAGALLGELAPERVEAELARPGAARGASFGNRFRARWQTYRDRYAQLSRRDGALSLVFGKAFRDAYVTYSRGARAASARRAAKLG